MFLNNCETEVLGTTHSFHRLSVQGLLMHLVEVIETPAERDSEMLTLGCIVGTRDGQIALVCQRSGGRGQLDEVASHLKKRN